MIIFQQEKYRIEDYEIKDTKSFFGTIIKEKLNDWRSKKSTGFSNKTNG